MGHPVQFIQHTDDGNDAIVSSDLDAATCNEVEHAVQVAFVQEIVTWRQVDRLQLGRQHPKTTCWYNTVCLLTPVLGRAS